MSKRAIQILLFGLTVAFTVPLAAAGNISLSVRYADIAEVFEMLSREGKTNILLSSDVTGEISVNLYDVSLQQAVRTVAAAAGYAVEYDDGTYYIVSREEAGKDIAGGLTEVRSFKIQYSDPELVAEILENHLSRYGKITALPERNLLVVEDLPDFIRRLENLLTELDKQPAQILIEARILEITLDASDTYGIDWTRLFSSDGGVGRVAAQGFASLTAPGLFFSLFNSNVEAVLNALSVKGRVRTLSTPKLLALEHEEAEVIIGDEIGYRVTTTINQVTTESVEFLETGIIMRVRSYVDRAGRIMMDIHPEVSSGTVTLDGVPSKKSTEVTTRLLAEDGQTIFIGGLIRNTASQRRENVPIIGDLPLIERLFGRSEQLLIKTETVVLITPHIVRHERVTTGRDAEAEDRLERLDRELNEQIENTDERLGRRTRAPIEDRGWTPPKPPAEQQEDDAESEYGYTLVDPRADESNKGVNDCNRPGPAFAMGACAAPLSLNTRKLFNDFK